MFYPKLGYSSHSSKDAQMHSSSNFMELVGFKVVSDGRKV